MHIRFVIDPRGASWPDLEGLDEGEIARTPGRFVGGRNSWIAQTYLRLREPLRARGWTVSTGATFLPGTVSVVHRDDANRFAAQPPATFLVVVRADRAPVHACDLAICQNNLAPLPHERFIPLWPQPGLRPRDGRRGDRIERLAYMGRTRFAPPWFRDPAFRAALAQLDVHFEIREHDWHTYDDVDLVLAARAESETVLKTKPATKVTNGWLAGAPVLAMPEPAYLEVRRGGLDFLQVGGPEDVLRGVRLLRQRPDLYAAMVLNGRQRGRDYTVDRVRDRWIALLEGEVADAARVPRSLRRPAWYLQAMLRQRAASKLHKWAVARWRASV